MAKMKKPGSAAAAGNVILRFNAEPHHVLEADGSKCNGGGTITVSAETAKELVAAPWVDVDVVSDEAAPQWPDADAELDALAAKLNVELPQVPEAGGAPAPTIAEKVAALEAAGFTPATAFAAAESTTPSDAPASDGASKEE